MHSAMNRTSFQDVKNLKPFDVETSTESLVVITTPTLSQYIALR